MAEVRAALAEALLARQRVLGTGPRAEAHARAIGAGAAVVVAGQQPGLLGGPLLSLHKAAGAIAEARRRSDAEGRVVVPVFWVASEDHDWGEVNGATVFDAQGSLRDLALDVRGDLRSVADVPVPRESTDRLLRDLTGMLPSTDRAKAAIDLARPPGDGPTDMGTWFGTILARLLGDAGLVIVEPHVVAPWAGEALARLVHDAERIGDALRAEGARRRAARVLAPLDPPAGQAPLFLRDAPGGPRRRVRLDGDDVYLREQRAGTSRSALEALLRREPHLASGDVAGRVFVQNLVLPVVAILAGPTEAAYLAQVAAAHLALGLPFPQVLPRPQATWVEAKVREALVGNGLSVEDAIAGTAKAGATKAADDPLTRDAEEILRRVRDLQARAFESRTAAGEPAPLPLERGLPAVEAELRRAIDRQHEEREARAGRGRARVERALVALRPKGQPQERVLSPLSLVARHGVEALRSGLSRLAPGTPPATLDLG